MRYLVQIANSLTDAYPRGEARPEFEAGGLLKRLPLYNRVSAQL